MSDQLDIPTWPERERGLLVCEGRVGVDEEKLDWTSDAHEATLISLTTNTTCPSVIPRSLVLCELCCRIYRRKLRSGRPMTVLHARAGCELLAQNCLRCPQRQYTNVVCNTLSTITSEANCLYIPVRKYMYDCRFAIFLIISLVYYSRYYRINKHSV